MMNFHAPYVFNVFRKPQIQHIPDQMHPAPWRNMLVTKLQ